MILGGSTNAVLHLIAIAHSVGINLTIDDFQSVSDRVPFIADLKPSGKYVMEDVYKIGGIPGSLSFSGSISGQFLFPFCRRLRSFSEIWFLGFSAFVSVVPEEFFLFFSLPDCLNISSLIRLADPIHSRFVQRSCIIC